MTNYYCGIEDTLATYKKNVATIMSKKSLETNPDLGAYDLSNFEDGLYLFGKESGDFMKFKARAPYNGNKYLELGTHRLFFVASHKIVKEIRYTGRANNV